jgi:hypothetical protein
MRAAVALILVALVAHVAHANPPGLTEPTPPGMMAPVGPAPEPAAPRLKSYGTTTLLVDAAAVGILLLAIEQDDYETGESLAKLAIGTYVFGAPIVHLTKNKAGRALGSAAMRVGFPLIGIAMGLELTDNEDEGAVLGLLAGVVSASLIDAAYIAKGDPPPKAQPGWAPTASASQNGFAVGVGGRF